MNEMRKLVETLQLIEDDEKEVFVDTIKGNQKIVVAYNEDTRTLDIRGEPTSLGTWHRIMSRALAQDGGDGTYNEFDVNVVAAGLRDAIVGLGIGETDLKFTPAREYSVAMYISGAYETLEQLGNYIDKNREKFAEVDELNLYEAGKDDVPGPVIRLWWD
jgi:hypothetical protein